MQPILLCQNVQSFECEYRNQADSKSQSQDFSQVILPQHDPEEECKNCRIKQNIGDDFSIYFTPISIYNVHLQILQQYRTMWLKKLFKGEKEEQLQKGEVEPMEEDENMKESRVFTVPQEEVDLRYSNLKIINIKSLHIPLNEVHFIESVFFSEKQLVEGKAKFAEQYRTLEELIVTDRQIIMIPDILALNPKKSIRTNNVLHIYYGMIERIEAIEVKKETPKLQFTLKDSRVFILQCVVGDKLKDIEKLVKEFGFPNGINKFYAFKYGKIDKKENGWKIYNFAKEMQRQGVVSYTFDPTTDKKPMDIHAYQIVYNKTFEVSPTYPKSFIVPLGLTPAQIITCSKFRTKERLPILTYFFEYEPGMFVSLFRCSQIKSGILSARCEQDEKMIREINCSTQSLSKLKNSRVNCKIYDARGFYAALGNKLSGKGFEHTQNYSCEIQFLNIPNIHAVRDCYNKAKGYNPQKGFIEVLGESGWIDYLFLILSGAKSMVKSLMKGINVIVHCSDGWDRTSQLSALAQLLIDPYYRTIEGFIVLVEKDWRQCGHKFRVRSGQFNHVDYHQKQISPIFIQFLDCVVQIMSQFPLSFEFNMQMLSFIGVAYQSNTYGTFLTNNVKQCSELNLQINTISVWSDVLESRSKYLNTFYSKNGPKILQLSVDSKDSVIWKQFLLEQFSTKEQQWSIISRQLQINTNLKENIINYDKEIESLRQRLKK